jgi:thioredoxin reductase
VSFVTGERGSILDSKRHGCDVVFMCAGMEPNTSFLGGGALKASLDEKGFIKTGATGRVLVRVLRSSYQFVYVQYGKLQVD